MINTIRSAGENLLPIIPGPSIYFALDQAIQKKATETWPVVSAYFATAGAKVADFSFYCLRIFRIAGVLGVAAVRIANYCWIGGAILNLGTLAINFYEGRESNKFQRDNSDLAATIRCLNSQQIHKYFKVDAKDVDRFRSKVEQMRNKGLVNQILSNRISQVNNSRRIGCVAALVFLVAATILLLPYIVPAVLPLLALGYGLMCWEGYRNRSANLFYQLET